MVSPIPPTNSGKNRGDSISRNLGNSLGNHRNRQVRIADPADSVKILNIFDDIIQEAEQKPYESNSNVNNVGKKDQKSDGLAKSV